ncbi:MAG: dihydrolipoyl dehydrogenase [Chitinispirillaceae bacterium]|nr:dihydrolipoyl dehydrogenase [Chitinispirillaceae bacterium]
MAESFNYEVVILGAGPGGYVAAIRAAQLKLSVAIIEKEKLGGVCLNVGCIPSKSLIYQAEVFRSAAALEQMGIEVDRSNFDYAKVQAASRKAADTLSKGVAFLLKKNGVTVIPGTGIIQSAHEVKVDGVRVVTCRNLIIATGSRPREIPGFAFDEKRVLSSTGALMLTQLPKRLLIVGAGAIGIEFAHIMNSFGVTVNLVEMLDRILPLEDDEVTELLRKLLVKRGVTISTSTKAMSMTATGSGADVLLEDAAGKRQTIAVDNILVVTGRTPNTDNIGLENIGISTGRGFIPAGDYGETAVRGVYAIGDVVPTPLLAHVASKEGEVAVEHIAGLSPSPRIDPTTIPGAIYCEPQIAGFGITERTAKERGITYEKALFPYRGAGKAVAVGAPDGFVKLLTSPGTHDLLGAHIIGREAAELIHELLLAKSAELLPSDIISMIHAHPTLSETIVEAARMVEGRAIHV